MLGDSIPPVSRTPGTAKRSAFQKSLTRFWQRMGRLDYVVQKLGGYPGSGNQVDHLLKANNTATNLLGLLKAWYKYEASLVPFPQEVRRFQMRRDMCICPLCILSRMQFKHPSTENAKSENASKPKTFLSTSMTPPK